MENPAITSRKNPVVRAAALLKEAAARRKERKFLCEGARLCRDAALSGVGIETCFYTDRAARRYEEYLQPVLSAAKSAYLVEDHVADLLADTKNHQGIFCVCDTPKNLLPGASADFAGPCLVLENLQDPGNLGTVLRTAEAFGVGQAVLLGDCCDPLSPKALRAGMGAAFRLILREEKSPAALCEALKNRGYACHAAVPAAGAAHVTEIDFAAGSHAVFIGNEGSGLTNETISLCTDRVTIPMAGRAESLNASAAATVLLWEMVRGSKEAVHG